MEENAIFLVYVTIGTQEEGEHLARTLLNEKRIACANLLPKVKSLFFWEGEVQEEAECLLLLKTDSTRLKGLEDRICELHPYDTPEFLATRIDASSEDYAEWVRKTLRE